MAAEHVEDHVQPGQLTIHADRGSSMKSKSVAFLMADLGITKTHSRPHVSDDNPFSEAHFKTLKYRPDFPVRFGCIEDARAFCADFFRWYNTEQCVQVLVSTFGDPELRAGRLRITSIDRDPCLN